MSNEQVETATAQGGQHRRRWVRWLVWVVGGLVVLVAIAAGLFWWLTRGPEPGEFYSLPDDLDGAAVGTLLRSEPFDDGLPDGAMGWRILYVSTDERDEHIAVSGLVIAPTDPEPGPHPVLAWAHGTTGIARACAPSNTGDRWQESRT